MNRKEIERKAKYEGVLDIAGFKIPCYNLADGTSLLASNSIQVILKMVGEDEQKKRGTNLMKFLNQKSLKPFVDKEKNRRTFVPVVFRSLRGGREINGYEATILPDLCSVYLNREREALKRGEILPPKQAIIIEQARIVLKAIAKVGIIALVGEATGYQKVRDEFELQKMLKAYISEETLEWQKTFHDSFYEQLYRLWNKTPTAKRPWFFGTLTNELVYKKLPDGVLDALKKKTPKSKRLHQSLTPDIGKEHLKKQIHSVEALAKVSKDKNEFSELIERYYPSKGLKQKTSEVDFDKVLKSAINTPPLKLKDLKEQLKKKRKKRLK